MRNHALQCPNQITRIIGGEAQLGFRAHYARELIQHRHRNESPFVVSRFRPGIWKKNEYARKTRIRQRLDDVSRVALIKADIFNSGGGDFRQQFGRSGNIRLRADNADIRIAFGLGDKVLASSEANFQPHFAGFRRGEIVPGIKCPLRLDDQAGKKRFQQPRLICTRFRSLAATVVLVPAE